MEGQTQEVAPAPEAGAAAPAGDQGASVDPGTLSEADYAHQRKEFEDKNGPGSWLKNLNEVMPEPEEPSEQKPNKEAKPETPAEKPNGEAKNEDGEAIDGEITINADGKPIDTKTGRFVPRSAFLRVKGEAGELKQTKETLTAELIRARERLSIFEEATKAKDDKPADEPAEPVDPQDDIFGAYAFMANKVKELEGKLDSSTKTTAETLAETRNKDAFLSDARAFSVKEPTFVEAFTFLKEQYGAELEAIGVESKDERDTRITNDLRAFVSDALANKRSPAEMLYKLAIARGYQPKPAAEAGESEAEKKAREEIERINAGKEASASLSGSGSPGVGEQLTRDKVATLPEGEYFSARAAYIAKHGKAAWEKLLNA